MFERELLSRRGRQGMSDCSPGTFADAMAPSLDECKRARPGWYVGGAWRLSEETKCEAGTYTIEPGQSTCLSAEPGEYVPEDGWSKEPKECEPGETSGPEGCSCTRVRLARTPKTRPRRAARSPRRATTSQMTTKRKRFRATRATTRRVREPTSASSVHPAPTPTPRPNRGARKLKLESASPVQKSRFHDARRHRSRRTEGVAVDVDVIEAANSRVSHRSN